MKENSDMQETTTAADGGGVVGRRQWDEIGPELLALVKEASAMMRGPTYLFAEQQMIATLRMGLSWPERAAAVIALAEKDTP